jgi:hypothetical protein
MIDILLEVVVQLILQPIGGFIRWMVFRKKPLREYVKDNWEANLFVVIGLIASVAVMVILVKII